MEEYSFWMPPFRGTAIPAAISDFDADDDRFESLEILEVKYSHTSAAYLHITSDYFYFEH